jgi:hypothetical protein
MTLLYFIGRAIGAGAFASIIAGCGGNVTELNPAATESLARTHARPAYVELRLPRALGHVPGGRA